MQDRNKDIAIRFHQWMKANDNEKNAEQFFHFSDEEMYEYWAKLPIETKYDNTIKLVVSGTECECYLKVDKYAANGALALMAVNVKENDPVAYLTVNVEDHWKYVWAGTPSEDKYPMFPYLILKDYSENEGLAAQLKEQGVITNYASLADCNGRFQFAMLTPKWIEIITPLLEK
jgi:hypothetical protein